MIVDRRKIVTTHGYITLYLPDHPMAHKNGYVYQHRLVVSEQLGRVLEKWEQVHHKDGNKKNNDPSNLELVTDAEHRVRHRKVKDGRRMPGEENPTVICLCGCGQSGRPRKYISGHNQNSSNTKGFRNPKKGVRYGH